MDTNGGIYVGKYRYLRRDIQGIVWVPMAGLFTGDTVVRASITGFMGDSTDTYCVICGGQYGYLLRDLRGTVRIPIEGFTGDSRDTYHEIYRGQYENLSLNLRGTLRIPIVRDFWGTVRVPIAEFMGNTGDSIRVRFTYRRIFASTLFSVLTPPLTQRRTFFATIA